MKNTFRKVNSAMGVKENKFFEYYNSGICHWGIGDISFKKILEYTENKSILENEKEMVRLNCNCDILQLDLFMRKTKAMLFNEHPVLKDYSGWEYYVPRVFKTIPYVHYIAKSETYGHMKYVYCLNNVCIYFTIGAHKIPRSSDFSLNPYCYGTNDVFLDLETTGLNPLFDDVISIALFQPSTGKKFQKYLPLEKQSTISEEITSINGITEKTLKDATSLTQSDIDKLIEFFDIKQNNLTIWAGRDMFDVSFLNCYFREHNLTDHKTFKFQNAREAVKSYELFKNFGSSSKDVIAKTFFIDISKSHNALEDCKIEAQICEKIHNGIKPEIPDWDSIISEMESNFITMSEERSKELYDKLCLWCQAENGLVNQDYDENPTKRGKEGIDIHHIDEEILDDIGRRTEKAQEDKDFKELQKLKQYNRKDRLVYATKKQHFLLHCLIEKMRWGVGGGPHYLYANLIIKSVYGVLPSYQEIYAKLIVFEGLSIDEISMRYWPVVFSQNDCDFQIIRNEVKTLKAIVKQLKSK